MTQKRVNPSWTPTPTMIRENPRLPRWVPGGHPMNPLGVRALYLGSSTIVFTVQTPLDHRLGGLQGLHPDVQQGCPRPHPRVHVGAKVTVTWNRFGGGAGPATLTDSERRRPGNRTYRRVKRRTDKRSASHASRKSRRQAHRAIAANE
ncbi:MAG: hypothetical protein R3D67_18175 [Hyphomicrobiaceae bacterium]